MGNRDMKIRLDKADIAFSRYIRLRDKKCCRCGKKGTGKDRIVGLQASHYFGRAREATRFLPSNVDALCFFCHRYWGSDNREDYRNFKIQQLGQEEFDKLTISANTYCKRDRNGAYLYAKQLLKSLV